MPKIAVSLFSSSGIGDMGLKANGIKTVVACELLPARTKLLKLNHPEAKTFCGDIRLLKDQIISFYRKTYKSSPFILLATPPCQGMSSNGMGKILNSLRNGERPKFDERNSLIKPAVEIIKALNPKWVILENVPNMLGTVIPDGDNEDSVITISDYLTRELGDIYEGTPSVIDVADYGVPQHRKRLILILHRSKSPAKSVSFMPKPTHGKNSPSLEPWITLRDVIHDLPSLSAETGKNVCNEFPLHRVPLLDEKKMFWVSNTPEGQTALNNQCVNPKCLYQGNPIHGSKHDKDGINKAKTDTPLYCEKCGSLLPRPYVVDRLTGEKRFMKAFTSAYKRMSWDEPASTLTQNFQYACSDNKLHPTQNRVLSLHEAMIIQTILPYGFSFELGGKFVTDGLIRDSIGESIPPMLIDKIVKHILARHKH